MDIYIFNELSSPFATITEAKEHLATFINICFKARELGFKALHLHENIGKSLYDLPIAPDYTVSQWLQDSEEDVKNQFREIITKTPLITDDYPFEKERNERSEFKIEINHQTQFADGLGAAYLLETLCVSFLSHDLWDTDEIKNVEYYYLTEEGSDVVTKEIAVKHASKPAHLEKHQAWFEQKKRESLQKSQDLWKQRKEFFPHLVLCGEVEKQLTHLGIQSKFFDQIIEKLKQLNEYAQNWQNGSYSDQIAKQYGLNVSGESEGTLKKYGRQRKFRLPNKKKELFEKHIKTGDLRFHFYPNEESHTIYVGYIGSHLSTVKYK
ncbi:hypothetical protein PN36_14600 [Candidatus Thiomargarita nelsonii]|uniref:Uncharacterized protein n=1 Tax=Candidatus Thiomargarita nelsonii TaxID=1003181 RepID=A0A0A6PMI1_9GAMM|nr:hypothetical protein PN36_14600 [Candidatus Thiomargarita nelsonii]